MGVSNCNGASAASSPSVSLAPMVKCEQEENNLLDAIRHKRKCEDDAGDDKISRKKRACGGLQTTQATCALQVKVGAMQVEVMRQRATAAEEALQKSEEVKQELDKRLLASEKAAETLARRSARRMFEKKAEFCRYKKNREENSASERQIANEQTDLIDCLLAITHHQDAQLSLWSDKGNAITRALNDLRYVENFGESPSRGVMTCPISLDPLGRNDSVAMLQCECDCNCMIKESFARKIVDKFYDNDQDDLTCLICSTKVDSIKYSTVEQAEIIFAWRAVQRTIGCSDLDAVTKRRVEYIERKREEQKIQDTSALRRER